MAFDFKKKSAYQSFYGSPIRLLHNRFLKAIEKDPSQPYISFDVVTKKFNSAETHKLHNKSLISMIIYFPKDVSEYEFYWMIKDCIQELTTRNGYMRRWVNTGVGSKNKLRNIRYRDFLIKSQQKAKEPHTNIDIAQKPPETTQKNE